MQATEGTEYTEKDKTPGFSVVAAGSNSKLTVADVFPL